MKRKEQPHTSRGFTLIEMMVALTLGLIMLAGAMSVLFSSKITYAENERVAHLQESMRAGMEMILRDLRGGGYPGCAHSMAEEDFITTLKSPTHLLWNFAQPLTGFDATGNQWLPALDATLANAAHPPLPGNDILAIRSVRSNARFYRTSEDMATGKDPVVVTKDAGEELPAYPALFISDCDKSTVFAATAVTGAASDLTAQFAHDSSRNSDEDIGVYQTGAIVAPVDTVVYYIARSSNSTAANPLPSLWRIVGSEPAETPGDPQEVVEGVEAMQIQYGEDTNGDRLVDQYLTANNVTNWGDVVAVRLSMLVRSPEESGAERDRGTYDLLDVRVGPFADRRQRMLLTTTVALRNLAS